MSKDLLIIAKHITSQAFDVIQTYSNQRQSQTKTGVFDLVTKADLASEEVILRLLNEKFPKHNIISEEKGVIDKGSEYTWFVDPMDGTTSWISRIPHSNVAIGLLRNNLPILGVTKNIFTGDLCSGLVGEGATLNGQPISVSQTDSLEKAVLSSDFQNTVEQREKDLIRHGKLVRKARGLYILGGAVHGTSLVAQGKLDGFVHVCKRWDFAATAALVIAAGGKVTDWQGHEIDWTKEWIEAIFSNGKIHDQLVDVLAA